MGPSTLRLLTAPFAEAHHATDTRHPKSPLTHAEWQLVVAPYGASLRGLYRRSAGGVREEVITGYSGAKNKIGGQGDVLIPFPGRVTEGRYSFGGQTYQMDKNDKETPSAIHGFLRSIIWEAEQPAPDEVTFTTNLHPDAHPGYPFALGVRVTYHLSDTGLAVAFVIENTGDTPAPVAAGFPPLFHRRLRAD